MKSRKFTIFVTQSHQMIKRIEAAFKDFAHKCANEAEETKEAAEIVKRHLAGHKLSKEEKRKVELAIYDNLKVVGIIIPMILLPGATIILPILIRVAKKHNIELMPSSFN